LASTNAPDWTDYDVSSWTATLEENRGVRAKTWMQSLGKLATLFICLALGACSEVTPAEVYLIHGTVASYRNNVHQESDECLSALAPGLREATVTVSKVDGERYLVTDTGCRFTLPLRDGVLSGENVPCDIDPDSALAAVGLTERTYSTFRLNIATGALEYRLKQRRNAGDGSVLSCFVFSGEAQPSP